MLRSSMSAGFVETRDGQYNGRGAKKGNRRLRRPVLHHSFRARREHGPALKSSMRSPTERDPRRGRVVGDMCAVDFSRLGRAAAHRARGRAATSSERRGDGPTGRPRKGAPAAGMAQPFTSGERPCSFSPGLTVLLQDSSKKAPPSDVVRTCGVRGSVLESSRLPHATQTRLTCFGITCQAPRARARPRGSLRTWALSSFPGRSNNFARWRWVSTGRYSSRVSLPGPVLRVRYRGQRLARKTFVGSP